MLGPATYAEIDRRLAAEDAAVPQPRESRRRQPLHTVYVPADRVGPDLPQRWADQARAALREHGVPYPVELHERVLAKLAREPIEDLRIDLEDGYGVRDDATEDADARAAAAIVAATPTPFIGIRIKSLERATRTRALRTLDIFVDALLGAAGSIPDGFVLTLPKVSTTAQVEAMVELCRALEPEPGALRFEFQIETPLSVLGADGTAPVTRMIQAAGDRCAGLHFGTYDYTAACGIAAAYQSLDHPAADHAKAVMQVAAATFGVRVSDGSTNVLPVGDAQAVHAAWALHARLVRRSLERGFYQGWDLHPAQLPTRFATCYAFFRDGAALAAIRLSSWLAARAGATDGSASGYLDEPATARALAGFLRRGLDCGAFEPGELDVDLAAVDRALNPGQS